MYSCRFAPPKKDIKAQTFSFLDPFCTFESAPSYKSSPVRFAHNSSHSPVAKSSGGKHVIGSVTDMAIDLFAKVHNRLSLPFKEMITVRSCSGYLAPLFTIQRYYVDAKMSYIEKADLHYLPDR
ncbi:hypothetical protein CSKR_102427 [Clonorchis sinensis]|uniref:Uncharacterized protein n=1 Tax=Clonorchis sinensis TaxID=79923 RepID=A0A3R7F630_CLOSI|nr:hypothetical protein CSKR_102427 [Clonorchis sinensis]